MTDTRLSVFLEDAKRITLVGAVVNFFLAVFKLFIGFIAQSHALIADGVHSLSDLLTDFLVLVTAHYGQQDADDEHPYGHGRIETLGSVIIAVLLVGVAIGIMVDALYNVFSGEPIPRPGNLAIVMAVVSVLTNEWLYHITLRVGHRIHSSVVIANAWHHRSDALSSIIVVVGLVGTYAGFAYLDAIAAVLVAVLIFKMGVKLAWTGLRELIDTSVDATTIAHIKSHIAAVPGVSACHQLRTRSMGGKVIVDVHVIVGPKVSVSEGHYIGEQVEALLLRDVKHCIDVTVHVDPEDDERCPSCHALPARAEVIEAVESALGEKGCDRYVIHYLSGQIELECGVNLARFPNAVDMQSFAEDVRTRLEGIDWLRSCNVEFI